MINTYVQLSTFSMKMGKNVVDHKSINLMMTESNYVMNDDLRPEGTN